MNKIYNKRIKSKNKFITIVMVFILTILSFNFNYKVSAEPTTQTNTYRLPVFETSDVHGYIAEKNGDNYRYLLSYISDKVKDVRGYDNYRKDLALLLDGGDIYQGNTMSNLLNGSSLSAAYKTMDYDAVTIGNHEFDWGIENTVDNDKTMMDSNNEDFLSVNNIPVLCSNLYLNNQKVSFARDYIIIEKTAKNSNGEEITVKIAVIGFAENYASEIMTSQFTGKGYSIKEDFNIPNNIAKQLEESGQVDATILLCHQDAIEVTEKMDKDGILNESVIDIILGGHTHYNAKGQTENGMTYMEPASYGKAYNYCEFVFEKDENGKIVLNTIDNIENKSVDLDKTINKPENREELDNDMVVLTDKVINKVKPILETKIGYITIEAGTKEYIDGSGEFSTVGGNWASSIYQRGTGADIAFVNKTGVRYDFKLPEDATTRDVMLGDIYTTYPFENRLYKYEITYEDLLQLLNYGVKDRYHSFTSSIVGIDCYYEENEVNALVKDGVLIYQDGNWKDNWKNKIVTVVTNEYVATTDKVFTGGVHKPMVEWNNTSKLIDNEKIDSECAIRILTEEAQDNNGLLTIDKEAHYILGKYEEQQNENPVVPIIYDYIEGANKTFSLDENETLSFRINADYSLFKNGGSVYIDNLLVASNNYISSSGSTIITFNKDYASSLSEGEHTLKVAFNNGGEAITKFTIAKAEQTEITTLVEEPTTTTSDNPKTGDNIAIWICLLVISMIGVIVTVELVKKNQ